MQYWFAVNFGTLSTGSYMNMYVQVILQRWQNLEHFLLELLARVNPMQSKLNIRKEYKDTTMLFYIERISSKFQLTYFQGIFLRSRNIFDSNIYTFPSVLYVQEVVTRPKILNRTILSNWIHVT